MTWNLEWDDRARRELRRLDRQAQRNILKYFSNRIVTEEDPRRFGKLLPAPGIVRLVKRWGRSC